MVPLVPEPVAPPAPPRPVMRIEPAEVGQQRWLDRDFSCRAISTTRYRTCRFEVADDGRVRLRFRHADITCEDVRFDEAGDPAALNDCRARWLRIPRDNPLVRADDARDPTARRAWAGSTHGWRWTSDGEAYCCPGLWILEPREEAPPP